MLKKLELSGFKSIRQMQLELKPINVLIGANGAGKSNLIEIFHLLKSLQNNCLQLHIGKAGGANCLLHYGASVTKEIMACLSINTNKALIKYRLHLTATVGDTLIFAGESLLGLLDDKPIEQSLGSGHKETLLNSSEYQNNLMAKVVSNEIENYHIFHFHDTSDTARLRANCDIDNHYTLMSDGGNLAAILYKLREFKRPYYDRIVKTIRLIAPFFKDFVLKPEINPNYIQLRWQDRNSDYEFRAHQLSDGTLRTMVLITLLLQPETDLPVLIVLDEPEIGLHPYAIHIIASLIQSVSAQTQIILATQSCTFLDYFEPEQVIVVGQEQGLSSFKRLDSASLSEWLEEYTLSELWEKNVTGGHPSR
ncbi:MAG: chromosome segregation protein SMC [Gammaproteobacteria bacterium]|nr:MAG: chromosome segregation protein SMC [Gammaproteobacteria bacterium]RKZ75226.1 MAG: chromosome segregation protein SMC [Gammaproteobacteria bacterium]